MIDDPVEQRPDGSLWVKCTKDRPHTGDKEGSFNIYHPDANTDPNEDNHFMCENCGHSWWV
jgi:hypothetical protein